MTALCRDIMNNIYKMYVSTGLLVMFSVLFSCLKANAFLYIQKSLEFSKKLFRSACVLSKCNTSYGS